MIDEATYDSLALQLEQELSKNSCVAWHVCRYDEILHDAHIPSESTYKQMAIWFQVDIEHQVRASCIYVARALVEHADNHIDIIKGLVAEQIALVLIEKGIV